MATSDIRACLLLQSVPTLSNKMLVVMLRHFGSPSGLLDSQFADWIALGLPPAVAGELELARRQGIHPDCPLSMAAQLELLTVADAGVMVLTDDRYPALLGTIFDPPAILYYRGDPSLMSRPLLAMVGSRKASPSGLRVAMELASSAVSLGLGVCSGLALGIDSAAHRGALAGQGGTLAVMATGIEQVYPRRHQRLAQEILEQGCLLTEFPPGLPPLRQNFPRRNRIISGLSLATIVVEAALPSGSLLTAGSALEQGREVFALPWSIHHRNGRGCLRLLRDGAGLVESVEDVLAELGPMYQLQQDLFTSAAASPGALPADRASLLELVGFEATSVDVLAAHSGQPVAKVLSSLSELELAGLVTQAAAGYIRC
ncbi:MAG: DNA-processing protein DprA [Halioglobus sp.]